MLIHLFDNRFIDYVDDFDATDFDTDLMKRLILGDTDDI